MALVSFEVQREIGELRHKLWGGELWGGFLSPATFAENRHRCVGSVGGDALRVLVRCVQGLRSGNKA